MNTSMNVLVKFVRMRTKNTLMNVQENDDKAEGSLSEKLKYVNYSEHFQLIGAADTGAISFPPQLAPIPMYWA